MSKNRFKEPSTWAGLAALLQVAKVFFPVYALAFDGLTAAAGSFAMALPENGAQSVSPNS